MSITSVSCYCSQACENPIPLIACFAEEFSSWCETQEEFTRNWVKNNNFKAEPNTFCLIPNNQGQIYQVLVGMPAKIERFSTAFLTDRLPLGIYKFDKSWPENALWFGALAWGLGSYRYLRYKKASAKAVTFPTLCISDLPFRMRLEEYVATMYWIRDLINIPAQDLGPPQLAKATADIAQSHGQHSASYHGEELLKYNFPAVYAVGKAGSQPPCVAHFSWGDPNHPRIALIGKGICFDSGGLDIKSAAGMRIMKKDMAGAAYALGLARLIMAFHLPVHLDVWIAAAENSVGSQSYRPGDVLTMRNGTTVEIDNTDAEGRLVLADILVAATENQPNLLIDFATLTGAARIALGLDVPVYFSNSDQLANEVKEAQEHSGELLWRLPLYAPYRPHLDSYIADMSNCSESHYGGAIHAALFLQEFVSNTPWLHIDMMAWNLRSRPGRPEGGEVIGLATIFEFIKHNHKQLKNLKIS